MRPTSETTAPPHDLLAEIVDELCDAHLDTVELATAAPMSPEWDRHVRYLQDLQRAARTLLARAAA